MSDDFGWRAYWSNPHPDAQDVLDSIIAGESSTFYDHPSVAGLLLAQDQTNFILRVGALLGARKITEAQAAALVRGLGVTILNPDEQEPEAAP